MIRKNKTKSYLIRITQGVSPYKFYHLKAYSGDTFEDCLLKALQSAGISRDDQYDFEINAIGEGEALHRKEQSSSFCKI